MLGWVDRYEVRTTKGGKAYDHAGYVGTLPTWKAVSHLRHARGRGSLGLRWRYIGSMEHSSKVLNPASTAPPVDAHSYYDLFGRWRFGEHLVLDAGINNLFDKAPPQVGNTPGTTHNVTYDIYGRQYFVGLSVKL